MIGANPQADNALIDHIVYLASLASESKTIDSLMDTLRRITATRTPGQPLTARDRAKLVQLQHQLEEYLLHNDPLRRYTRQSFEHNTNAQTQNVAALRWGLAVTWLGALFAAIVTILLPIGLPLAIKASIALPIFIIALHIGGAWFYWSALSTFKAEIRRAYALVVIGIITIGLTAVQFPFIVATDISNQPLLLYGGTIPLFTVAIFLFYLAMRTIARRLQLRSTAASLPIIGGLTAVVIIVSLLLPHVPVRYEAFFDLSMASDLLVTLYCVAGAILAFKIARHTAAPYAKAMRFFAYTLVVAAVNVTWYGVCLLFFGELSTTELMIAMAPHGLTEAMLMSSGYVFRKQVSVA